MISSSKARRDKKPPYALAKNSSTPSQGCPPEPAQRVSVTMTIPAGRSGILSAILKGGGDFLSNLVFGVGTGLVAESFSYKSATRNASGSGTRLDVSVLPRTL